MTVDVYVGEDIKNAIDDVCTRLTDVLHLLDSTVLVSKRDKPQLQTSLQTFFNLTFDNKLSKTVYELVVMHGIAAEKMAAGGFIQCIRMVHNNLLLLQKGIPAQNISNKTKTHVIESVVATKSDIYNLLSDYITDELTQSIVHEAIQLAGFAGRISIEKSQSIRPSIELIRGYTFNVDSCFKRAIKLDEPRIFCIDGFIERVSEIDHLLQASSISKDNVLLLARGMNEEVIHTLKINFDRGTLRVVPCIVKFDIQGINMMNDISISTGCDLVSSNKGDLISSIKFDNAPRIKCAHVHNSKTVIHNDKTIKSVLAHVQFLRRKREESSVEDVTMLIDERIKSLSPNHVIIRLPDNKDYVRTSQAIDYSLRAIKSAIDHGVSYEKKLTVTQVASDVHAHACISSISQLGAIVIPAL